MVLAERALAEPATTDQGSNTADRFQVIVHISAETLAANGHLNLSDPPEIEHRASGFTFGSPSGYPLKNNADDLTSGDCATLIANVSESSDVEAVGIISRSTL